MLREVFCNGIDSMTATTDRDLNQEGSSIPSSCHWSEYEQVTGKSNSWFDRLHVRPDMIKEGGYIRPQNIYGGFANKSIVATIDVYFDEDFLSYKVYQLLRNLSIEEDGSYAFSSDKVREVGKDAFEKGFSMYLEERKKNEQEQIETSLNNIAVSLGLEMDDIRGKLGLD